MPIGAAILGGGSLLAGLLSSLGVGQTQGSTEQINPYTDQFYQQLLQQISQAQSNQQGAINQASTASANQGQIAGDIRGTQQDIEGLQGPGAMDWFQNFLGAVPEYQRIAQEAGQQFTEVAGRSIQENARLQQSQAVSDAAAQFAGQNAFSGAAASAVGQAAAQPLAQAQAQLTGQQANIASQTFNQLSGQGQGLAAQGTQGEFNNALAQLSQALQAQQVQAGIFGQQAGSFNQQASIFGSNLNQLQANQAQAAAPVYQQTQGSDPLAIISQLLGGAGGLANMIGPNTNLGQGAGQQFGGQPFGVNLNDPFSNRGR